MLVRMKTRIGGYRNGEPWPAPGETIDVPAHEAHGLIANGYATQERDDSEPITGELIDGATGAVLATGLELELTNDGTGAALPAADPDNNEERESDADWTFSDTPEHGDAEAATDGDSSTAGDSGTQAATEPVAPAAGAATKPTAARTSKPAAKPKPKR